MNIFYISDDPQECAKYLDDKRVVKMCLESTQILCTVFNQKGIKTPYKSTHINHPCVKWAGYSLDNWIWLYDLAEYLCLEYFERFNKIHKCSYILEELLTLYTKRKIKFENEEFTTPPNCTTFKHITDIKKAYKLYLQDKWKNDKIKPKWSNEKD